MKVFETRGDDEYERGRRDETSISKRYRSSCTVQLETPGTFDPLYRNMTLAQKKPFKAQI